MKYVSYLRVSTKKQGDSGLGLESQRDIIKYYYPQLEKEFLEVQSAKNITDRPVLNEAIAYCLKNDCTLIVAKIDRLSRDVKDGLYIIDKLPGRIVFCDLPNPDRFTITLYFALAEKERDLIRIRTRAALQRKREKGEPMGSNIVTNKNRFNIALIQYKQSGANAMKQKSKDNPENKKSYEFAISLKSQGLSLEKICEKLNTSHSTSTGSKWSKGTLSKLFKRYR